MSSVLSKPDRLPVEALLLDVADVLATSLDLDTTVRRVAEVVRKVIDYEIFAILLLYEKTQDLRFRFQVGYPQEFADRTRIKVGEGVTGLAAQLRQSVLIDDVTKDPRYIEAVPNVRSGLAVPLITKNRVIGVIATSPKNMSACSLWSRRGWPPASRTHSSIPESASRREFSCC